MSAIGGTPPSEDDARTRFARVELPVVLADTVASRDYLRRRPDSLIRTLSRENVERLLS